MKKVFYLILAVAISISMFLGCSSSIEDEELSKEVEESNTVEVSESEYVEGELVVAFDEANDFSIEDTSDIIEDQISTLEGQDFTVVSSILDYNEQEELKMDDDFKAKVIDTMGFVYLVEYSERFESVIDAIEELENNLSEEKVQYIEPNYELEADENSLDMHPNQEWHYEMINAPQAWENTIGSEAVKVAVLDTGIDYEHESLADLLDNDLRKNLTDDEDGDRQGHGTHVAGTVGSYNQVSGVMQDVTLIDVKVLNDQGRGNAYTTSQGIIYAAEVGADVVNMSLGGSNYSEHYKDALRVAEKENTISVAASGNGFSSTISYPAGYEEVIAVGAVDSNRERANFSNYGDGLEFMAPGTEIYSTRPNDSYSSLSGTSMAAPHVAGVVGLMRAVNSDINVDEVREILADTAQEAGDSEEYGHGIVDSYQAVIEAEEDDYDSNYDNVYLRGTLNDWDTTGMKLVADNTWEADVSFDGGEDDRFKFDIYGDWELNYGDDNGDGYANQNGADIFVEQAGEYTITFNDETKEYNVELRSGNGYDSNYDNVYLRGTLNDWDTTGMELVADNTWEAEVSFAGEEDHRFKFDIYGDWSLNYGDDNGDGYANQNGADIFVDQTGEYTITFNDETKEYTVEKNEDGYNAEITFETDEQLDINILDKEVLLLIEPTVTDREVVDSANIKLDDSGNHYVEFSGLDGDELYKVEFRKTHRYDDLASFVGTTSFSSQDEDDITEEVVIRERDESREIEIDLQSAEEDDVTSLIAGEEAELYFNGEHQDDIEIIDSDSAGIAFRGALGEYEIDVDVIGDDGNRYKGEVDFEVTFMERYPHNEELELTKTSAYDSNYDNVYLRGTLNDWDTTGMELVADNTWEAEVSFDGEDNHRFKFDIYGDWELNYGDDNGDGYANQNGADIFVDQAGEYIITFNDETKEYTVELRSGNGYDSNYDNVYLRGTLNDWDTTGMELVADNTWEAEVSFDDEEDHRFKFDIYGDWELNYGDDNGDGYANQNGADIPVADAGDYTITFDDETKEYTVE